MIDFILKLGGSAITVKSKFETLKHSEVSETARDLKEAFNCKKKFMVVHGAGSFGHFQAAEYGVNAGVGENASRAREGFCKTRLSVCKLNQLVTAALVEAGIPAVAISPCGVWSTSDGQVTSDGCDVIAQVLEAGLVPVVHGDAVIDGVKGTNILSGDTIIEVACRRFPPRHVIFASDVHGIYTQPPELEGACLISEVHVTNETARYSLFAPSDTSDVTSTSEAHAHYDVTYHMTAQPQNQTMNFGEHKQKTRTKGISKELSSQNADYDVTTCQGIVTSQHEHDVTGGIELKLKSAVNIVKHSKGLTKVVICQINSEAFKNLLCAGERDRTHKATLISMSNQ